jgi:16S rRNA (uracil1498-N3)-methyltransferase
MADRYFVDSPIEGDAATLTGPEAHHLAHVMRAAPGTEVVLFDGSGKQFAARVDRVQRNEVHLSILSGGTVDRELAFALTLGVSLPKGDRQKWLVEKAVELGIQRIVPLPAARSVAQPGHEALARLRRTVIEASKQCGRNRLLELAEPQAWVEFVHSAPSPSCRLLAHPGIQTDVASGTAPSTSRAGRHPSEDVYLAIGPEGGFTPEEVGVALAAGWQPVDLGPRILRVETAAIFLTALVISRGRME